MNNNTCIHFGTLAEVRDPQTCVRKECHHYSSCVQASTKEVWMLRTYNLNTIGNQIELFANTPEGKKKATDRALFIATFHDLQEKQVYMPSKARVWSNWTPRFGGIAQVELSLVEVKG